MFHILLPCVGGIVSCPADMITLTTQSSYGLLDGSIWSSSTMLLLLCWTLAEYSLSYLLENIDRVLGLCVSEVIE